MAIVEYGTTERTYLQAVNLVLASIGEGAVGSLSNPTPRMTNAMNAVESARDDVFYKKLWQWRRGLLWFDGENSSLKFYDGSGWDALH